MTIHPMLPLAVLVAASALLICAQLVCLRGYFATRNKPQLLRWMALTGAVVLLLLAATRVVLPKDEGTDTQAADRTAPNIFLVVDRSPDMTVSDLSDSRRIDLVHRDIQALLGRYPEARFAVIGFASQPSLDWPLSADVWSLGAVLTRIDPYPYSRDSVGASNAGAADVVLRYQLIAAAQQYPKAPNLVFYFGAGTPESTTPARPFDLPTGLVDAGAVLGYGTGAGGPIPGTDIASSAVDVPVLRSIAAELDVPFVARSNTEPWPIDLPEVPASVGTAVTAAGMGPVETYWAPTIGAALLILFELYFVLRDVRRSRLLEVAWR